MSVVEEDLYEEDFDDIVSDASDVGKTPPPGELSSIPSDAPASISEPAAADGIKVAATAAGAVREASTTSSAAAGAEILETAPVTPLSDNKPVPSQDSDSMELSTVVESTGKKSEPTLESIRPPVVPKESPDGAGGSAAAGSEAGVQPFKPSGRDLASADKAEETVPEPIVKISAVPEGSENPPPPSQVVAREAPAVTSRQRPSPATDKISSPEPPMGEGKPASGAGIAGEFRPTSNLSSTEGAGGASLGGVGSVQRRRSPSTLNPQPSTLTLNPNPKPQTLNPKP